MVQKELNMAGEARVADLDPFDLLDVEAERCAKFFESSPDWSAPTRCEGWNVRDLLAHVAGVEVYHTACLDDSLGALFEEMGAKGATDVDSFNAVLVEEGRAKSPEELLATWRQRNGDVRRRLRERGRDGTLASSVGPYPVGLMAFHIASEYATHADDMAVPIPPNEAASRTAWRAKVSEFAVEEASKPVEFEAKGDSYEVRLESTAATLPAADFVEAVSARLPADYAIDPALRDALRALA
jgi:uncharacterized protein (TIGR03083 family)